MRRVFWKIIVAIIVKNRTVHAIVATDNDFVSKLRLLAIQVHNSDIVDLLFSEAYQTDRFFYLTVIRLFDKK